MVLQIEKKVKIGRYVSLYRWQVCFKASLLWTLGSETKPEKQWIAAAQMRCGNFSFDDKTPAYTPQKQKIQKIFQKFFIFLFQFVVVCVTIKPQQIVVYGKNVVLPVGRGLFP